MLGAGARVAIVAPAGVFQPERLAAGVAVAESWGYLTVPAPNLGARHRHNAGTVAQRASDLAWALTAPDIDAVWFARGGFGTAHLLPHLPWGALDGRPVIGFSDATALLVNLASRGHRAAVHGPVLHALAPAHLDEDGREGLRALLAGEGSAALPGAQVAGPAVEVEAPLTGGNLAVLASLCGTPWAWSARGQIAVLEDVGEAAYRLDRMLTQLLQSGALDGCLGVALGELVDCRAPPDADWTAERVLVDLLTPLGVPVLTGLPVGHGRRNLAWTHGARARLHAGGLDVARG